LKYCPKCKLRATDEDESCSKCGGSLRQAGASKAQQDGAPETSDQDDELTLKLAGLQHQVEQDRARVRWLGVLAGVLAAALVVLLIGAHLRGVLQYARLGELAIIPSAKDAATVDIAYVPLCAGKVEFVRSSADKHETLLDHVDPAAMGDESEERFTWSGSGSKKYTISVRYRRGLGLTSQLWRSADRPKR